MLKYFLILVPIFIGYPALASDLETICGKLRIMQCGLLPDPEPVIVTNEGENVPMSASGEGGTTEASLRFSIIHYLMQPGTSYCMKGRFISLLAKDDEPQLKLTDCTVPFVLDWAWKQR